MKYEISDKFRAEILRHFAYTLFTPMCGIALKVILLELDIDATMVPSLLFASISLIVGFGVMNRAYQITMVLDQKIEGKI